MCMIDVNYISTHVPKQYFKNFLIFYLLSLYSESSQTYSNNLQLTSFAHLTLFWKLWYGLYIVS